MEKQTIGRFISALRKANGYTQAQLAEKLGVSDKAVSRWERDETAPDLTLIPVIAELFGVTCDELLRGQRSAPQNAGTAPELQPQRSKYLRQHLKKALTTFQVRSAIALGVGVLGLIAAMICNLVFLRASLGLLLGCIFYGAGILTQWIFLTLARNAVDEDEFDTEQIALHRRQLTYISMRTFYIILLLLCATLPLTMVNDSHMGLSGPSWAVSACYYLCAGLILVWAVWAAARALGRAERDNSRQYRYARIIALVMALLLVANWMFGQILPTLLMRPIQFDNWEDFKTYMERSDDTIIYQDGGNAIESVIPPDAPIYYDNDGNEISEEEFLTETITDKDGNVLCTYLNKNQNVYQIDYNLPDDPTQLRISVLTQSERNRAAFVTGEIQELYIFLYPIVIGMITLFYFRKKQS